MTLFTNLKHRWAQVINPPDFAYNLQSIGILQTRKHHHQHHILATKYDEDGKPIPGIYYCVIGNLLNPVLHQINFWRYLEYVIYKVSGLEPMHTNQFIKN